jgi:hypothetical protein
MEMLFELGLTRKQVAELMGVGYGFVQNVYARKYGTSRRNLLTGATEFTFEFNRKFGVEIEAYGVSRSRLYEALRNKGINVESEGYNHVTRDHWKITTDGSISGESSFEIVSPILQGESGLEDLKKVAEALKELNAKVNKTCGLHIHFSAEDFQIANWKNLYYNYASLESEIDKTMPESRRADSNYYCRSLVRFGWREKIERARDLRGLTRALTNGNRYFKLNGEAFWRHRTVEFRQHSGTIEFAKIKNWILFTARLVEFSRTRRVDGQDWESARVFLNDELNNYFEQRKARLAS